MDHKCIDVVLYKTMISIKANHVILFYKVWDLFISKIVFFYVWGNSIRQNGWSECLIWWTKRDILLLEVL